MGKPKNILKTCTKDDDTNTKKTKIKNVRFKATVKAKEAESTFTKVYSYARLLSLKIPKPKKIF
jgi:hypothetical protein